jgi:hypothetical protein
LAPQFVVVICFGKKFSIRWEIPTGKRNGQKFNDLENPDGDMKNVLTDFFFLLENAM